MNRIPQSVLGLIALAATLSLAACNKPSQETAEGKSGVQKTGEQKTAGQKVDEGIADVKSATKELGADAKAAAARTADAVSGTAKDLAITAKVNAALAADDKLSAISVNVDTTDGRVALKGNAPDATSRDRAKTLAAGVEGVVAVDNRLTVGQKK